MLLRFTLLFICLLRSIVPVHAQESVVEIQISNIRLVDGTIMVALYDNAEHFLTANIVQSAMDPVRKSGTQTMMLSGIEPGEYAISIFHDVNANGILDKNFLGIPKEPYGFSHNARGRFGPPKFADAKFSVQKQHQVLEISLY